MTGPLDHDPGATDMAAPGRFGADADTAPLPILEHVKAALHEGQAAPSPAPRLAAVAYPLPLGTPAPADLVGTPAEAAPTAGSPPPPRSPRP
ncbi:hypothetical protein [Motilibacter deserti]|uniref:Uncharacterized protein n=1 Tax=Motilibacter deserti TaxID=2714956 RepID=A0ABX0H2M0_9ACTN|nr:hypothetical protein [Motilibacter deserti]NHC16111.1 hypothetical protein [Motilibacter deserti]